MNVRPACHQRRRASGGTLLGLGNEIAVSEDTVGLDIGVIVSPSNMRP